MELEEEKSMLDEVVSLLFDDWEERMTLEYSPNEKMDTIILCLKPEGILWTVEIDKIHSHYMGYIQDSSVAERVEMVIF